MEAVYLLFAFTITFGVGIVVGYGFRALIAKEITAAKNDLAKVQADAKADYAKAVADLEKLVSEVKSKL